MGECHGITYPDRNEIQIRQDVYDRAIAGSGRDRLTLAHELGHLLFHEKQNISYARVGDNTGIVVFETGMAGRCFWRRSFNAERSNKGT